MVSLPKALPRTKLLQQIKKHFGRAAFRVEEGRRARLVARRDHELKLADLSDGGVGSRCGSTAGVVTNSAAISFAAGESSTRAGGSASRRSRRSTSPSHPDAPRGRRRP